MAYFYALNSVLTYVLLLWLAMSIALIIAFGLFFCVQGGTEPLDEKAEEAFRPKE